MQSKQDIRERMLGTRAARPVNPVEAGRAVASALASLPQWTQARVVAAYSACGGEIDVTPCIRDALARHCVVVLPRYNRDLRCYEMACITDPEKDVSTGAFGIGEPVAGCTTASAAQLSGPGVCWLVPGVAFDACGNRLGRGAGHYDAMLKGVAGVRIGAAFDWQVIDAVPAGAGDVPMDFVVTERRVLRCLHTDAGPYTENQHGKG